MRQTDPTLPRCGTDPIQVRLMAFEAKQPVRCKSCWHFRRLCSVARIRGLENLSCLDTWGFARKASLHPRLYAYACSAG